MGDGCLRDHGGWDFAVRCVIDGVSLATSYFAFRCTSVSCECPQVISNLASFSCEGWKAAKHKVESTAKHDSLTELSLVQTLLKTSTSTLVASEALWDASKARQSQGRAAQDGVGVPSGRSD